MEKIDLDIVRNAMTYKKYISAIKNLLLQGEVSTKGTFSGNQMLHYTEFNLQRMNELDKTIQLTHDTLKRLKLIDKPTIWLVITEGWCGDAGQIVPVVEKMAQQNPNIIHRLIFRDEHLNIIDAFLTDEGRSIPKLIVLNVDGTVLTSWGPRPQSLQTIIQEEKAKMREMSKEERKAYFEVLKTMVHTWYEKDKTQSIQKELLDSLMPIKS